VIAPVRQQEQDMSIQDYVLRKDVLGVGQNRGRQLFPCDGGRRNLILGVASGLVVVVCWAGWIVATRFAVTTHLGPYDIAFLRYLVSSVLLAPVLMREGLGLRRIGVWNTLVLVCGAGLPFLLVASTGMTFAPASDVGAVMVGTMPVFVAVLSAVIGRERFDALRVAGFVAVIAGIAGIGAHGLFNFHSGAWRGHLLFLAAAAMFATYTVTLRRSGLGPWQAAAIVNFYSLLIIAPVYLVLSGSHLLQVPMAEVGTQAVMQGVVAGIVALFFFGEAVRRLGASRAAVLGSLTPALAALLAIPLLGEFPTHLTWVAIMVVSIGVVLASGGFSGRSPEGRKGANR
jgi:drug/metabolite transporter (DMT)-like permease